jgi:hypothetical protein
MIEKTVNLFEKFKTLAWTLPLLDLLSVVNTVIMVQRRKELG